MTAASSDTAGSETGPAQQFITPELRAWVLEQIKAGVSSQDVLAAMVAAGWLPDKALQAMEEVMLPADLRLRASLPGVQASPWSQEPIPADLHVATRLPEPALDGRSWMVTADGHRTEVVMSLQFPRVVVFGGLLSRDDCQGLMDLSRPRLARSETVQNDTGGSEVHAARTSDGMFFERGEFALVRRIEARIAELLCWPVENGEGVQILRYRPGAEYRPHYDYFDPRHPGSARILARGGQRVATLVIYLNTPEGGGATTFPDAGLQVEPVQGNAVFFSYDRAHGSTRTLHGGAPVTAGEKWVATKWMRERVFQ